MTAFQLKFRAGLLSQQLEEKAALKTVVKESLEKHAEDIWRGLGNDSGWFMVI